jgi:alcohol dehydrogenase class IV
VKAAGLEPALYDAVTAEPIDQSFLAGAKFAAKVRFDGYVSVGGGSVIDTCNAANLYPTSPADFLDYVNAPIGAGLTQGAWAQKRSLTNAPRDISEGDLSQFYRGAMRYW